MKYSELINKVAKSTGIKDTDVRKSLSTAIGIIMDTVRAGEDVNLSDLGKIVPKKRASRMGINPTTLDKIQIPERSTAVLKISKEFKEYLNSEVVKHA